QASPQPTRPAPTTFESWLPMDSEARNKSNCNASSWMRMPDNVMPARIKCNANYHNSRLALMQAQRDGYNASFLLNSRGKLAEASAMCVFIVRNDQLITPSVTNDILESITRQTVIELAREYLGLETVERDVDRTELILAQEVLYCGTAAEITPGDIHRPYGCWERSAWGHYTTVDRDLWSHRNRQE
ncbi:aminotransferase class IV, partial [Bradyrhizobium sp. 146]|uniref:aminotransferase class IV n=1 Tax=Bradyrhizobium sp. 146 TaxID=2782622 RepID=UPI001FFBD9AE